MENVMTSCKKIICWECHDDAHYTRSGPEISHRFHLLPDKWREKELLPLHDDRTRHLTWAYVLGYSRQGTAKGLPASRCTDPSSQRAVPGCIPVFHALVKRMQRQFCMSAWKAEHPEQLAQLCFPSIRLPVYHLQLRQSISLFVQGPD
eukprot:1137879-Pelagomonas_calceolata.AAC.1